MPAISPGLQQLERTGIYARTATPHDWRTDLAHIRLADRRAEKRRANLGNALLVLGAALVLGLLVAFVEGDGPIVGIGFGVALLALVGLVVVMVMRSGVAKVDYENRRYELANELIGLLEADLEPEERVSLRLDLRPADAPGKREKLPEKVNDWTVTQVRDPFLVLRARLCDGTRIAVIVTHHVLMREKWKTGRSGKLKRKSKHDVWLSADVRIKLPPERAQALAHAYQHNARAMQVPAHARVERFRRDAKGIVLRVSSAQEWGTRREGEQAFLARDLVAMPLVSLFQLLGQPEKSARSA